MDILRLGTRASPLAMVQAEQVKALIEAQAPRFSEPDRVQLQKISTSGDQIQDRPLNQVGGKGLFTKELEQALLDGQIDLAVHSLKDVSVYQPEGLTLAAYLPREAVADVLITKEGFTLDQIPKNAVLGTASLRRQALLKARRPDLQLKLFRGSVQTRLRKLNQGMADATVLALAGLKRLGMDRSVPHQVLDPSWCLPAMAQGAIAIQIRKDAPSVLMDLMASLNHAETEICVTAERAALTVLDGSCRTPLAGLAQIQGQELKLRLFAGSSDGEQAYWEEGQGPINDPKALGANLGHKLRAKAGEAFFQEMAKTALGWS